MKKKIKRKPRVRKEYSSKESDKRIILNMLKSKGYIKFYNVDDTSLALTKEDLINNLKFVQTEYVNIYRYKNYKVNFILDFQDGFDNVSFINYDYGNNLDFKKDGEYRKTDEELLNFISAYERRLADKTEEKETLDKIEIMHNRYTKEIKRRQLERRKEKIIEIYEK